MEVILATAFGHKIDVINGEADELTTASSSIFAFATGGTGTSVTTILCNNNNTFSLTVELFHNSDVPPLNVYQFKRCIVIQ